MTVILIRKLIVHKYNTNIPAFFDQFEATVNTLRIKFVNLDLMIIIRLNGFVLIMQVNSPVPV